MCGQNCVLSRLRGFSEKKKNSWRIARRDRAFPSVHASAADAKLNGSSKLTATQDSEAQLVLFIAVITQFPGCPVPQLIAAGMHGLLLWMVPLHTTRISLIEKLQGNGPDAWSEVSRTYGPMMHRWLRSHRVSRQDSEDISQEVLIQLTGKIEQFQHNGSPGAFRSWMRRITLNVMRNFLRARATKPMDQDEPVAKILELMEDPDSDLTHEFQRQHNLFVLQRLLDSLKSKFAAENLELFRRYCIAGEEPEDVASAMGVSKNAVYLAKFRIMRALKAAVANFDELLTTGEVVLD